MSTPFSKPICGLLNNCLSIYLRKRNEGEGCLTFPSIDKTLFKKRRIGSLEISYIEYCEVDETIKGGQFWVSVRHIKVSFSSFKLTFVRISFPFRETGKGSMRSVREFGLLLQNNL